MIIKTIFTISILSTLLFSEFNFQTTKITEDIKQRMIKGNSWRKGCPVPLKNLRYLRVKYHNFYGGEQMGELIVHKDIANDVIWIMADLYSIGYPIRGMRLVSDFNGNDWQSIEADNTSAFNCRPATGSKKWSKHAYGRAIDINPIENPYISKKGHISHKASLKYRKRVHRDRSFADMAVLLRYDEATKIFKSYDFTWGGDWRYTKDYQHFVKKTP